MFLEIHDLKKSFGSGNNRTEVLKGIEFTANKGEICVLLGPSGSGKSTLLNIIGPAVCGDGTDVARCGVPDRAAHEDRMGKTSHPLRHAAVCA